MPNRNTFKSFVLDQLSSLRELQAKAMFGGLGLYCGDQFFGILLGGRLYFKTDAVSRAEYVRRAMPPLTYEKRGRKLSMRYYEVPPDVLEDRAELVVWAERAICSEYNRQTMRPRRR